MAYPEKLYSLGLYEGKNRRGKVMIGSFTPRGASEGFTFVLEPYPPNFETKPGKRRPKFLLKVLRRQDRPGSTATPDDFASAF